MPTDDPATGEFPVRDRVWEAFFGGSADARISELEEGDGIVAIDSGTTEDR